jgi:sterol O-acyltransferase
MTAFTILPGYVVIENRLPPASAMIILMEQVRLLMKTYAFVRSNAARALKNGAHFIQVGGYTETDNSNHATEPADELNFDEKEASYNDRVLCPEFSKYLYFMFAPTLVYRDHYPRTARVNWNVVVSNLTQVFMCVLYVNYVFVRFCIPVFQDFSKEDVTLKTFLRSILNCHLPGTLLLLIGFFAFLHCWLNAFAEMLCFGDRMFYKDWWNSTNFSMYYRTVC